MMFQAKCPRCRTVLRIPAEWVHKAVRCKHCGTVVRAQKKTAAESSGTATARQRTAEPADDDFDFAAPPPRKSRRSLMGLAAAGIGLLALIGIALVVYHLTPAGDSSDQSKRDNPAQADGQGRALPVFTGPFPRRLLAIQVSNYFYFDPVGYGAQPYDGHSFVDRLAKFLHVPPSQVAELSDAAPGQLARPPLKPVIEKVVTDFLKNNRAQDRVIVLFSGHLVEIDGQAFLVPLEGDPGDKATVIPLAWIYDQLAKCRAKQKVLLLDACRRDPSRGVVRQSGGPMGDKTFAALRQPPAGVQVWTACAAGQYSNEDRSVLQGGVFLTEILKTLAPGKEAAGFGIQQPQDPLPFEPLNAVVNPATEREVASLFRQKQTPQLFGAPADADAAFDANEPLPPKTVIEWRPAKGFVAADRNLVQSVLREAAEIPPVKGQAAGAERFRAELFPIFPQSVMKDYRPDNAQTPFRNSVRQAVATLKKHAKTFQETYYGNPTEIKKRVPNDQRKLADADRDLRDALDVLLEAGKQRDREKSKRWLAYYDYVHARLLERIAYTFEYNYMLAMIRTDSLPDRDPKKNETGWRLASREKMQAKGEDGRQAKKFAEDAKKLLAKMAEEHRGTPWEIFAKRDAMTALGLEWRPTR